MRIGILGGTFDPIHWGHLLIAEGVREKFALDRVYFIPAAWPPHKVKNKVTEAAHRYKMALLATQDNSHFSVSDLEMNRPGKSYTIETVKELKEKHEGAEIYFIIGLDSALEIFTWKDPEKLLGLCRFISVQRPFSEELEKLDKKYRERIEVVEVPTLPISSTEIRERVRKGRSIKYLVPQSVEEYIYKNRLYKN
ncbi:putative nicotinate-nucleotide adenylyltransferase [subsurface metagenome]